MVERRPDVLKEVPFVESRPIAVDHSFDRQNSPPPTDPIPPRPATTSAPVITRPTTTTTMMPSDDDSEHTKSESITHRDDAPLTRHYSASSRTSDTRSEKQAPIRHQTEEDVTSAPKAVPKSMTAFRSDSSHTDTAARDGSRNNTHSAKSVSQPSSSSSSEEPAGYQLPRNRGGGGSSISPPGGRGGGSRTLGIPQQGGLGGGRATASLPSLFGGILGSGGSAPSSSGSSSSAPMGSRLGGTAPQPKRQPLKAKPLSALLNANHDSSDDSSNF